MFINAGGRHTNSELSKQYCESLVMCPTSIYQQDQSPTCKQLLLLVVMIIARIEVKRRGHVSYCLFPGLFAFIQLGQLKRQKSGDS